MYEDIAVTGFYFAKGDTARSFPKRIETQEGRQINFIGGGLRCVIKKGQEFLQVFTMSDGEQAVLPIAVRASAKLLEACDFKSLFDSILSISESIQEFTYCPVRKKQR